MNNFESFILQARSLGFIPIIAPKNIHELMLEESFTDQYNINEAEGYGWRIRGGWRLRGTTDGYVDIEFMSERSLSIHACCSSNNPDEFKIDILRNSKQEACDHSLCVCPADACVFNAAHLVHVDWGVISKTHSLIARVWPIKKDVELSFAIFGVRPYNLEHCDA